MALGVIIGIVATVIVIGIVAAVYFFKITFH